MENMTPKHFGNKEEHWRERVDEVRDYMDLVKPGMKDLLTSAERARDNEVVDAAWATSHNPTLGVEAIQVWRALTKLTEDFSEARQVVISVQVFVSLHQQQSHALHGALLETSGPSGRCCRHCYCFVQGPRLRRVRFISPRVSPC